MAYRTEILEACQDYGLVLGRNLIEYAGWRTRGSSNFNPKGSVNHHTAGPRSGDLPSLNTLLYGRPGLPGPLCNAALSRSAKIHLIAAGRANHAGLGGWKGLSGNSSVWGLEVEHIGYATEPVTDAQWDAMYRWHAACCDVSGVKADFVCQHFEWAPTRKIDFVKTITDPNKFRANVERLLAAPAPTPPPEDDEMPRLLLKGDIHPEWWITDGITKDLVEDKEHAGQLAFVGLVKWNNGGPFVVPQAMIDKIPNATVGDQIVWYVGNDGKGSHPYRVWGNVGKYLGAGSEGTTNVNLLKFLGLRQGNTPDKPLGKEWRANVVLIDGPARNLPVDAAPGTGGGLTAAQVQAAASAALVDSGLLGLLPGR